MSKYNDLLSIIDQLRKEAPSEYVDYHPGENQPEKMDNARSKSFIHLFLKVKFGLLTFKEREHFITDGTDDGGIDAYYIDKENRKIYYIQAKFRTNCQNFENKEIALEEILAMDVNRISEGDTRDEHGKKYNGKIQALIHDLKEISDLPKYDHVVILLANIKDSLYSRIRKIIGGFSPEIFNFEKCYNELVFPLASGTYYNASELKITINLDSKNTGHRIDYDVQTQCDECNINAFFVPVIEIAQILSKYKNSILKFNPRSYLDLASGSVNEKIAESITKIKTNEFALFNNGITMLSDNTDHSDKVGKKGRAEVIVTNPQIVNGGQTAFTLSRIYDNCLKNNISLDIFAGKEVLLKIITFTGEHDNTASGRLALIENISKATNQQSPIIEADRRANDKIQVELQSMIFKEFGLYYERKRGEFNDGLHNGYIKITDIIDRELFLKVCLAVQDRPHDSFRGQDQLFSSHIFNSILPNTSEYRKNVFAYIAYNILLSKINKFNIHPASRFAITTILSKNYSDQIPVADFRSMITEAINIILPQWMNFQSYVMGQEHNSRYFLTKFGENGNKYIETKWIAYYKARNLMNDLRSYFKLKQVDDINDFPV